MKNRYIDLVEQTFDFPQEEFEVIDNSLHFNNIPVLDIIEQYGTPLKITYLPKIGTQIQKARRYFNVAMAKADYKGSYTYCYCTKSSHFSFIIEQVVKEGAHIETSSTFDISIVRKLVEDGKLSKDSFVICNGYKKATYTDQIISLLKDGYSNVIPILDGVDELDKYEKYSGENKMKVGIRIATEEEPNFEFYTSRLGINPSAIIDFYKSKIKTNPNLELKMLHFFINTGIRDTAYYWAELNKCIDLYCRLKKICPTLDSLDIGGGFPIKANLDFNFDYQYMADEIIRQIKSGCAQKKVREPNIFTEFGSFTVGESGAVFYKVMGTKKQNDKETWNMIDSSFITTLPDIWGIKQKFILLAINHWDKEYKRVNLGGLTCDSEDYYTMESVRNRVFMPVADTDDEPLYIGFFHTGAYQESLGGYGGIQHCLIPAPKHVLIDRDESGDYTTRLFAKEQSVKSMMKVLGY